MYHDMSMEVSFIITATVYRIAAKMSMVMTKQHSSPYDGLSHCKINGTFRGTNATDCVKATRFFHSTVKIIFSLIETIS